MDPRIPPLCKLFLISFFLPSFLLIDCFQSLYIILSDHFLLLLSCLIMASPSNPKQQQQGSGGIIGGGGGFDVNKLFKPSFSNRMNIMQPYVQQEQQQQQGHSPSTNSNNGIVSLIYIHIKAGSQLGLPGSTGFRVDPPGFVGPTPKRVFTQTRTGPRPKISFILFYRCVVH